MNSRRELRSQQGHLLGVLVGGTALEIKRGAALYTIDLRSTVYGGVPVIIERCLYPDGAPATPRKEATA